MNLVQAACEEYSTTMQENEKNILLILRTQKTIALASSKSYLQHVTNKSDSKLDGVERNKQMVVMSVGKYDPKNSGELNGMENIRVFSRSYNVNDFVENSIQAIPL